MRKQNSYISRFRKDFYVAICHSGLGDAFYMSIILRHLKTKDNNRCTIFVVDDRVAELFNGLDFIDVIDIIPKSPDQGNILDKYQKLAGSKVFYYDLFHSDPSLAPWPNAEWKGHRIFERYKNVMPDPELIDCQTKNYLPVATHSLASERIADSFINHHGLDKFVVLEYKPVSFWPPLKMKTYLMLMEQLLRHDYQCLWMAGDGDPGFPIGIDGRGLSFGVSRALMSKAAGFVGIGSGLTCLACTLPDVNKIEIQDNGIYCFKTVYPKSKNHWTISPKMRISNIASYIMEKIITNDYSSRKSNREES